MFDKLRHYRVSVKPSTNVCATLILFSVICRGSKSIADVYAVHVYPLLSAVLSFVSSLMPIHFQSIAIVIILIYAITLIVRGCRRRAKLKSVLSGEVKFLAWVYV